MGKVGPYYHLSKKGVRRLKRQLDRGDWSVGPEFRRRLIGRILTKWRSPHRPVDVLSRDVALARRVRCLKATGARKPYKEVFDEWQKQYPHSPPNSLEDLKKIIRRLPARSAAASQEDTRLAKKVQQLWRKFSSSKPTRYRPSRRPSPLY